MANAQRERMNLNLHVGTMGWSYSFWKGKFYPENLGSEGFLTFYAKQFDTVEVDSTFYHIPRAETVANWKQQTPEKFLFSLKFPQKITHFKRLQNCQEDTRVFLERASLLEEKLGALLLQLPPMFQLHQLPLIRDYLKNLPKEYHYVIEVRHKSLLNDELYDLLREQNVALAWIDAPKMPLADELTADFLYVRWEGDRKTVLGILGIQEANRTVQIQQWADKLRPFVKQGTSAFGYFSKYYSGLPTSDAHELHQLIVLEGAIL